MFIRQPVVYVAMEIKARVPGVALFFSRVAVDVLALLAVAHLELVRGAHTGAPSVGWSGIVTVACAELYSSSAGPRALAKLAPRTPVSVLFDDVRGQPDAVAFKTVLSISTRGAVDGWSFLGLAEEGIVWVAAPELLTRVKGAILQGTKGELLKK